MFTSTEAAKLLGLSHEDFKGAVVAGHLPPPDLGSKRAWGLARFSAAWIAAAKGASVTPGGYQVFALSRRVVKATP